MARAKIDYARTKKLILILMYSAFERDESMIWKKVRIQTYLNIPNNLLSVCLEKLEDDGLIEEITRQRNRTVGVLSDKIATEWVGTGEYELTDDGRSWVERIPEEQYEIDLSAISEGASQSLFSRDGYATTPHVPQNWEPLSFGSNSETIKSAFSELVRHVEADNDYAINHPEERAEILAALSAAISILDKAGSFTYTSFYRYVIWPCEKIFSRFSLEGAVGSAAQFLIGTIRSLVRDEVKSFIKSAFKKVLDMD